MTRPLRSIKPELLKEVVTRRLANETMGNGYNAAKDYAFKHELSVYLASKVVHHIAAKKRD